jgi:hypothetical protein
MATLILGAVGGAIGGAFGGSVLGLTGAVIGRAAGAAIGQAIDQAVLGSGSGAVEHGRIDRLRLGGAGEGGAIPRVWGRHRLAGQVIWAGPFHEHVTESGGGGKGAPSGPTVRSYGYTVSLALALCEGEVARVGRIWADGREIARIDINMRVYGGDEAQLPDPLIAALEGDEAPAYRGTAYVVIEDLDLRPFGNRVPQLSFEVVRRAADAAGVPDAASLVRGVALVPGTGEYALATTPVHFSFGAGAKESANVNSVQELPDLVASLDDLVEEVPRLRSTALVVCWFGDDLRCGTCSLRPLVERLDREGEPMRWEVSGLDRDAAGTLPELDGRPVYGGTPADASVVEAIREMNARGIDVTFYPFILMTQLAGDGRPDPYGGAEQAPLPWRGRITTARAPGRAGTTDRTAAAEAEVAAFFGTASAGDFSVGDGEVRYDGPDEWGMRRFVLHYAALCAAAGGVEAFCIGTEMRGLTQIRGAADGFPGVAQLRALAGEVRALLPGAKISYAADWSEYFGYHPADTGDVHFHLDPLWADPQIDFVGIDNYMPLSDWRDEAGHADASWGTIHDLGYLRANIEGGEGYDWYYPDRAARDAQARVPITDGAHGEPWVFRYKDLRGWWGNAHRDRIGGVRDAPTAWVPGSKPVRFVEIGCAAVDKGTNQPNKFLDPKSSESSLPWHSTGLRDDLIQANYLRALYSYWDEPGRNPVSAVYGGPMLDLDHTFVWAWDTRPWPAFPDYEELWADAANHARGHWISGRTGAQPLAQVIAEICRSAGLEAFDVSGVEGLVRGYAARDVQSARAELQPLLMAHGVEAAERDGRLVFSMRGRAARLPVARDELVRDGEAPVLEASRVPEPEVVGRVQVVHVDADGGHEARVGQAAHPEAAGVPVTRTEFDMALTAGEGRALAERFLVEARLGREAVRFALPPSRRDLGAGDLVQVEGLPGAWRVDRLEEGRVRRVEAVRAQERVFLPMASSGDRRRARRHRAALPVDAVFLDLPLLTGAEVPHAPHVACAAVPWPGAVAVMSSPVDAGYRLNRLVERPAIVGVTEGEMQAARPGVWDEGPDLAVRLPFGSLATAGMDALLAGANAAAIGDGSPAGWEVFQFREAALDPQRPGVWLLRGRLRGQRGTEGEMRSPWPAGSLFVLLDGGLSQIDLPAEARGELRHYRYGPADRPIDHESYSHAEIVAQGIGLRPYAPAHLTLTEEGGERVLRWTRRSRIGGDGWEGEVPLGEQREAYRVRALSGATVVAEAEVAEARWILAPGLTGPLTLEVAQISDPWGPGAASVLPLP